MVGRGGFALVDKAVALLLVVAVAVVAIVLLGRLCWDPRLPEEVILLFLTGLRLWPALLVQASVVDPFELLLPLLFLSSLFPCCCWWLHLTILAVSLNMQERDLEMKEERSFSS